MELSGSPVSGSEVNFSSSDEVTPWYRYDVNGNSDQKVVTHTFKYNGKQLRNYSLLYDRTKRAALWVAYAMNGDKYPHNVSRSDSWQYDPALKISSTDYFGQPKLSSSYTGGYTRGHQCASNDRRTTLYQMYQTDYFSNMTPQTDAFNAGSSTSWDELEEDIQTLGYATTGSDTLYVVTGAIFGAGYTSDAKDNNNTSCPVPTQYYKCVMKVSFNSSGVATSASGAAFLFDHSTGSKQNKTIKELETLTTFDFFANIPADIQINAENGTNKLTL